MNESRNFPKEYLIGLLETTDKPAQEIAEDTGYSYATVLRYSKEHRSPLKRYMSAYKAIREVDILPEQMVYLREEEKMTFNDIAKKIHVSEGYANRLYYHYKELLEREREWHAQHQRLRSV